MSDEAKRIDALKKHQPDQWDAFFQSHHLAIWRFIHRRVRCKQSADDITAEVFLSALNAIGHFHPKNGSLTAWLYRIVRCRLADHLRREYRRQNYVTFTSEPDGPEPVATEPVSGNCDVISVLNSLPAIECDVLVWMYQDQISVRQIADRLNRTEKAVENLLYRARRHFRQRYLTLPERKLSQDAKRIPRMAEK